VIKEYKYSRHGKVFTRIHRSGKDLLERNELLMIDYLSGIKKTKLCKKYNISRDNTNYIIRRHINLKKYRNLE